MMAIRSGDGVREVHGHAVRGVRVDAQTRCDHWHGPTDIIALRMKCCGAWVACHECHAAAADHPVQVWPLHQRDQPAVLCGACGEVLSIEAFLACASRCPGCHAAFNPGCQAHYHLYFEVS
jgi:uncharacterized CHY-type Zn-finger protein